MRKLIAIFWGAFLIVGCNQDGVKIADYHNVNTIEQLKEKELESGIEKDTLFLDYRFGMTKTEFLNHTSDLAKQDKIYSDSENLWVFDLTSQTGMIFQARWAPKYYKGKLYKLIIFVKPKPTKDLAFAYTPEIIQTVLRGIFLQTYGISDYKIGNYFNENPKYGWIDGNRHIELIVGVGDARIIYTNLSVQRKIEAAQKKRKEKQVKETMEAF